MGSLSSIVTEQNAYKTDFIQKGSGCGQRGVFFSLRRSQLLQSVLIDTLLIKTNCFIEDLATLLKVDSNKLRLVWQGNGRLSEKKSTELITLFYVLLNGH